MTLLSRLSIHWMITIAAPIAIVTGAPSSPRTHLPLSASEARSFQLWHAFDAGVRTAIAGQFRGAPVRMNYSTKAGRYSLTEYAPMLFRSRATRFFAGVIRRFLQKREPLFLRLADKTDDEIIDCFRHWDRHLHNWTGEFVHSIRRDIRPKTLLALTWTANLRKGKWFQPFDPSGSDPLAVTADDTITALVYSIVSYTSVIWFSIHRHFEFNTLRLYFLRLVEEETRLRTKCVGSNITSTVDASGEPIGELVAGKFCVNLGYRSPMESASEASRAITQKCESDDFRDLREQIHAWTPPARHSRRYTALVRSLMIYRDRLYDARREPEPAHVRVCVHIISVNHADSDDTANSMD